MRDLPVSFSPPQIRPPDPKRPSSQAMLARVVAQWGGAQDLWVFGYGSLIWRQEFDFSEQRLARVHGWHRALRMWSRVNRGTPEEPGLVLGLLSGGSVQGMVFRIPQATAGASLVDLWAREMPLAGVYDPKWLHCTTDAGPVRALAFTLSRRSPNYTGELSPAHYRHIFERAQGRYGSTLDYASDTYQCLRQHGIEDHHLRRLLAHAEPPRQPTRVRPHKP